MGPRKSNAWDIWFFPDADLSEDALLSTYGVTWAPRKGSTSTLSFAEYAARQKSLSRLLCVAQTAWKSQLGSGPHPS